MDEHNNLGICCGTNRSSADQTAKQPDGQNRQIGPDGMYYKNQDDQKGEKCRWSGFDKRGEHTFEGIPFEEMSLRPGKER